MTRKKQGTLRENFQRGERGPPRAPHLAPRNLLREPCSQPPAPRALPASGTGCISRALRGPWNWKVGGRGWPRSSFSSRRARLPSSSAELAAAAQLGVGRPAPLAPPPPFLVLSPAPLSLSASIGSDRPPLLFSLARHLSLHPASPAFLLPPPLAAPRPLGAGLLPSLPDKAVAARRLLPSCESGLRLPAPLPAWGGGVEVRGWGERAGSLTAFSKTPERDVVLALGSLWTVIATPRDQSLCPAKPTSSALDSPSREYGLFFLTPAYSRKGLS